MPDVFNATGTQHAGAFSADDAVISFAGVESASLGSAGALVGGVGPICQSLNWAFTQAVNIIYEIGTNFSYMIKGRARGQLSIGSVIGPRGLNAAFFRKFGDACQAASNNINLELGVGCGKALTESRATIKLKTVVLLTVGGSAGANDMLINEQTSGLYMRMEY